MSLLRPIIRTCAVAAIRQMTFAGAQVFDSNNTPFVDAVSGNATAPYVTVYTDADDRMPSKIDSNSGRQITSGDGRMLSLVIEMAVASAVKDTNTGNMIIQLAATDPGMEAAIDILETQVNRALFSGVGNAFGNCLRRIVMNIQKMPSRRGGQAASGVRFAARRTTFVCSTIDDIMPGSQLPDNHVVYEFIDLCNRSGSADFGDMAAVIQAALQDAPPMVVWEEAQARLGLSTWQTRILAVPGTPLPYPPLETPPYDYSDPGKTDPTLEEIILMGGTSVNGTPVSGNG